ncbi:hypothetical protein GC163_22550 [bacterium]|nr:hypothetical protein [bacterium]
MFSTALQDAIQQTAAWFPLPGRTSIEVRGKDRATFLHNFCTNEIKKLQPGQGCEAFFCNAKGRVIGHGSIFATNDALWIDSVPGQSQKLIAHLDRYLIREDVTLTDQTSASLALCSVATPSAVNPASRPDDLFTIDLNWQGLRCSLHIGPTSAIEQVMTDLQGQGAQFGTASDWDALRIAAGWPVYGLDITEENLPQEVARNDQAISFTKGCYLGQEPIARLDALGHTNRELRRLVIDGEIIPPAGANLSDSSTGDVVGHITSAALAPFQAGIVALGYLKTKWTKPGTVVTVESTPTMSATVQLM